MTQHSCDNFFELANNLTAGRGDVAADDGRAAARRYYAACQAESVVSKLNSAVDFKARGSQRDAQITIDHISSAVEAAANRQCDVAERHIGQAWTILGALKGTGKYPDTKTQKYTDALNYGNAIVNGCRGR